MLISTTSPNLGKTKNKEAKEELKSLKLQINSLFKGTVAKIGEEFFLSVVEHLSNALNVKYAFICESIPDEHLSTLAFWAQNKHLDNFTYCLEGTPCKEAITRGFCYYPKNIQKKFPEDKDLVTLNAESYISVCLYDSSGKPIGLIGCLDEKAMDFDDEEINLLHMFATRASTELERRNTEIRLKDTIKELARSNSELEKFAHITSHDLREPLRSMSVCTQLLQEKYLNSLDEKGKELMDLVIDGAKRMNELVDNLLSYSKIGTESLLFERINCNEIVADVEKNLSRIIEEKNVEIKSTDLPIIIADKTQITQLIQNIISNGIKYNKSKNIKILIDSNITDEHWHLWIKDNGIGIDKEHTDEIFTAFKRLENKKDYPGTGIGLAICDRVIKNHHGKIWVESENNKGSTFHFTIPIRTKDYLLNSKAA